MKDPKEAGEKWDELLFPTDNSREVEDFVLLDYRIRNLIDKLPVASDYQKGVLRVDIGDEEA